MHEDFINIIKACWNEQEPNNPNSFFKNYYKFKTKALYWKKHVFGDLNRKIEEIENHIANLNVTISRVYSDHTHQQLVIFEKEHQFLLKQKELYWKQRARIRCLKDADNNTKFFHAYATNRRRRNMIQSLKHNNTWVHNLDEIKQFFIKNVKDLYNSNNILSFSFDNCNNVTIDSTNHTQFTKIPDKQEIKNALNMIGPDKAPGPDGLNAHFFQKYWEFVGPLTSNTIVNFF